MLTKNQKKSRCNISKYLQSPYEDDPEEFIRELWPKMRLESITLVPRLKSRLCNRSILTHPLIRNLRELLQVMASIFWDSQGVIMVDYPEEGRTINGSYYAEELRRLRQQIIKIKRRKLTRVVLFLQDNVPAHISGRTSQENLSGRTSKLHLVAEAVASATKCSFEVLPHLPYSPDLAASTSICFQIRKLTFVVGIFRSNVGVIDSVDKYLGEQDENRRLLFWRDKLTGS